MAFGRSRITLLLILMVSEIYGMGIQSNSREVNSIEDVMEELRGRMDMIQHNNDNLRLECEEMNNKYAMSQRHYDNLMYENERLKDQLNSMQDLLTRKERQLDNKTGLSVKEQTAGVVAFMARHNGVSLSPGNFIPFDIVDLNIGGAYNPAGVFIAPVSGIYQFSFMIQPDSNCDTYVLSKLMVNNSEFAYVWATNNNPAISSGGSSVIVQLTAGSNVTMKHSGGCGMYHFSTGANLFGGHLIYQIL